MFKDYNEMVAETTNVSTSHLYSHLFRRKIILNQSECHLNFAFV